MTNATRAATLTDFLLARIAEDEAVARDVVIPAHDGPNAYKPHPELAEWMYVDDGEVEYVQTSEMLAHPYWDRWYVTCDGEGLTPAVSGSVGRHIARHDPARVLAECAAKRRIVDDAMSAQHSLDSRRDPAPAAVHGHVLARRRVVRQLAAVYSDHPDYREEWRP